MDLEKNIKHKFNLEGLEPGDKFLGCTKCWFQLPAGAAAYPFCPKCEVTRRLSILYVTEEDKMGWGIGYDSNWKRDVGYGVPAKCDHPDCEKEIDRGLSYICGGEMFGGEKGCGLYFCEDHLYVGGENDDPQMCQRCCDKERPFAAKPDIERWIDWKLTDESWQQWRDENPDEVKKMKEILDA